MTAVASRLEVRGHTEPRLFTPPLRELTVETSLGFECIEFAEDVLGISLLPWQEWFLVHALELNPDGSYRFNTVVLLVGRQSGKALDVDTPMLTTGGWSSMGALRVGDTVFGVDGRPVAVKAATEVMQDRECYRVRMVDGREVIADADHQWTVQDTRRGDGRRGELKRYRWETLTTREMVERGVSRTYRRATGRESQVNHFVLPPQPVVQGVTAELPVDPYVLGYWLGDGSSDSGRLTVGHGDLSETLEHLGWERFRVYNWGAAPTVSLLGLMPILRQVGVLNNKHVPDDYLAADVAQRTALLQGLMDSDGTISGPKGHAEFCGMNRELCEGVATLARSLGFMVSMREGAATIDGRVVGTKYRVCFTPDVSGPRPFRLRRKLARVKKRERADRTARIASIEPVESRPVRCIQVDSEDGLYLAGRDLVPTHNSTVAQILTLWKMVMDGAKTVLTTAQNLDLANSTVLGVQEMVESIPELAGELETVGRAGGKFWFTLKSGAEFRAITADRKGARGRTADLVFIDEVREQRDWEAWNAIEATAYTRSSGMIMAVSNAGDAKSVVLKSLREAGLKAIRENDRATLTGLFEWSAPDDADIHDPESWAYALPGLGVTTVPQKVAEAASRPGNETGFKTESLCQWVEQIEVGPFGENGWRDCLDEGSRIADDSPVALGLDVAADRSHATLAVAGWRDDGLMHVEVIAHRAGTEWVAATVAKSPVYAAAGSVAVQGRGAPASTLIDALADAGVEVRRCEGADLTAAMGGMFDRVVGGQLRHVAQPALDAAAEQAAIKPLGDAWMFDRRKSPVDIGPLCAATFAAWALGKPVPVKQTAYGEGYDDWWNTSGDSGADQDKWWE